MFVSLDKYCSDGSYVNITNPQQNCPTNMDGFTEEEAGQMCLELLPFARTLQIFQMYFPDSDRRYFVLAESEPVALEILCKYYGYGGAVIERILGKVCNEIFLQ